jgi:hypothetical protein
MSASPLEDQVLEYVAAHRPLKLIALLVATIGIVSSAWSTLHEAAAPLRPYLYRLAGLSMERVERLQLGCAYETGGAKERLLQALKVAESTGQPEIQEETLEAYRIRFTHCIAVLGISKHVLQPIPDDAKASSPQLQISLRRGLASIEGTLAVGETKLPHLLFLIGDRLAWLATKTVPDSPDKGFAGEPLSPKDRSTVLEFNELLNDASRICPCTIPAIRFDPATTTNLATSAVELDNAISQLLAR